MKDITSNNSQRRENILRGFNTDIEKSRAGVYSDNAENRKLKRVGQKYGVPGQEDIPTDTKPTTPDKPKGDNVAAEIPTDKKPAGEKKTIADHAKDTPDDKLKAFVEKADENTDPKLLKEAKDELANRGLGEEKSGEEKPREEKTKTEIELEELEKEMSGLQESIDEAIAIHESMKNEKLKDMVYQSIDEGDAEMRKLKAKKDKLLEKKKEESKPKIEKDPDAFIVVSSVNDLSKKANELSTKATTELSNGNYDKAIKLIEESNKYSSAIADKLNEVKDNKKEIPDLETLKKEHDDLSKEYDIEMSLQARGAKNNVSKIESKMDKVQGQIDKLSKNKEENVGKDKVEGIDYDGIRQWSGDKIKDEHITSVINTLFGEGQLSKQDLRIKKATSPANESKLINDHVDYLYNKVRAGFWQKFLKKDQIKGIIKGAVMSSKNA